MENHTYNVHLSWKANKEGLLTAPQIDQKISVATPPPFNGGVDNIWSPEHLLISAVNSCFMTTFLAIAGNSSLAFTGFSCESKGTLEKKDGKYWISEIELEPAIIIVNASDKEKTERIIKKSEENCLITQSIKSAVSVKPQIIFG